MKQRIKLPILALAMAPMMAWATGTATISQDGKTATVAWTDSSLYVSNASEDKDFDHAVFRDGHMYAVGEQNGKPRVVDMGGMIKMAMGLAKSMGGKANVHSIKDSFKVKSMKPTGKTPTIAGIEGREYKVTTVDADGKATTGLVVFTDNPLAEELLRTALEQMSGVMQEPDLADYVIDQMPDDLHGVLSMQSDDGTITLQSINDDTPDASLFELPAKPVSFMELMMKAMQKAGKPN